MHTVREAYEAVWGRVLSARDPSSGVWAGELASSALATALAVKALATADDGGRRLAEKGAAWLVRHAHADGGWGDTPASASNLSATLIVTAALRGTGSPLSREAGSDEALKRAESWISQRVGAQDPASVARALRQVYGQDRTFAVPILSFLAMCSGEPEAWRAVPPLPFLLALMPRGFYRLLRLQVVSYALPALIAVGLCRHVCRAREAGVPPWGRLFSGPLLRRLQQLQPCHGGFLDAVPLTAFVCLALRHAGYGDHPVARKALSFLRDGARADGSWPIDSNLRTWVTSLATRAVTAGPPPGQDNVFPQGELARIAAWLVNTQVRETHPFTGAAPGGWAWTDLPGGVPDADDTAGALVALRRLQDAGCATDVSRAVCGGVRWLLALQNPDGGMPTFSKGWGRLPFDRSCPDISAHALVAFASWRSAGAEGDEDVTKASLRLIRYLAEAQQADGSWVPLWFGHQEAKDGKNPVVGTARVVDALRAVRTSSGTRTASEPLEPLLDKGERWLLAAQHADGGWGMGRGATVEETALAVIALAGGEGPCRAAAERGRGWLAEAAFDERMAPAPIGLYFSLLWYHERLYPLVWSCEALSGALQHA